MMKNVSIRLEEELIARIEYFRKKMESTPGLKISLGNAIRVLLEKALGNLPAKKKESKNKTRKDPKQ